MNIYQYIFELTSNITYWEILHLKILFPLILSFEKHLVQVARWHLNDEGEDEGDGEDEHAHEVTDMDKDTDKNKRDLWFGSKNKRYLAQGS